MLILSNFLQRIRRSIIKKFFVLNGYPKNHLIHHLFDGVRIDPIYQERPLTYKIHYQNSTFTTQSLYCFFEKFKHVNDIYIIGSGPSIKTQPINKIAKKNVILLNGAIKLIDMFDLTPLGIVIIDGSFIRKNSAMLKSIPKKTNLFLSFFAIKEIVRVAPYLLDNPIYLIHELKFDNDQIPISLDQKLAQFDKPTWGVLDGGTVMSVAIQLAAFIRAKNVWLLGLDISNSKTEPRFYENKNNICRSSLLNDYDKKILPFMIVAKKWYMNNSFNLYNCSPISKVPTEIIPFRDINESL